MPDLTGCRMTASHDPAVLHDTGADSHCYVYQDRVCDAVPCVVVSLGQIKRVNKALDLDPVADRLLQIVPKIDIAPADVW